MMKLGVFGKMKNMWSKIMSIITNIIPAIMPSTTSLASIFLIYNIPKNVVTIMVIIGTIMLTRGRLELKIGLNMLVNMEVIIQIKTPKIIANFSFIFKP